jgi:hypothetical protein
MFASGTFTPAQVEAQLTLLSSLRASVQAAQAVVKAKLADETAQAPALRELMLAFIAFVRATFSNSPDVLADFGLAPKKARTPLTVEQKAAAAAKREATRKARGTMGKKQKLAVMGNVTGVVVTPIVTPAAASTAQPAPSAPSNGSASAPSHVA